MTAYPEEVMMEQGEELPNGAPQRSNTSHQSLNRHEFQQSESEDSDNGNLQATQANDSHPKLRLAVRTAIGLLLFSVVLACVTLSKLTLIRLTDELRILTTNDTSNADNTSIKRVYWQLLFVMVLPHCLTFVRSAVVGVIGKTRKSYPWPSKRALYAGVVSSIAEVITISFFVFSVLCYLTADLALLTMQGVFFVQFLLDIYYIPSMCNCNSQRRSGYEVIGEIPQIAVQSVRMEGDFKQNESSLEKLRAKLRRFFQCILENKQIRFLAFVLQILGIGGLVAFIAVKAKMKSNIDLNPVIALPLSIATLSILWSNKVQEYLVTPQSGICDPPFNARYKANFINSAIRIFLYPFLAYGVFRAIHHDKDINPWSRLDSNFLGTGEELLIFLVQVLTSFFGYVFAWIACIMTLRTIGFAFPLLLSTPVALVITLRSHFYSANELFIEECHMYYVAACIWFAIYIGQLLGMAYFLCTKNNLILSQDKDMFINPHYDGVFLEQYLILNRQVDKYKVTESTVDGQPKSRRAIFICSTMFRETVREMRQLLVSIMGVARWHAKQVRRKEKDADLIESHIFFDGALSGGQLTQYALQLLSLVKESLGESVTNCLRKEELYGQSMSWDIGESQMKFTVHFKDSFKVKKKKRWSQVMYMNYVINYRIPQSLKKPDKKDHLHTENTFILSTDADIFFTAESAMVLLDSLTSNKEVGAVCARTHPKGSGVTYWYQVFDYAIGHWFWKPAEHFFGCVLCCPGCFSVFRCSALATVLKEYSSEVKGASDFLTKDMGEDRWLCTLLIQSGWRLDYCAISEDYTYCPESFDEFYKQRRRWIPSTMANLILLISKARNITKTNNSMSLLFIFFQTIVAFSTVISPATVILIIASGLQGAYHISNGAVLATIIVLGLLSIFYGVVCLYTSQKTQIDLAKALTFLFAIVMAVVIVGIFKQIIMELFPSDDGLKLLRPPECLNVTDQNSDCMTAMQHLEIVANLSGYKSFSPVHLPTSPTTWYYALFAVIFVVAALLHPGEWTCLIHLMWYLLALPSGYLLLLIYSAANLDSQSWGTREADVNVGGGFTMTKKWFRTGVTAVQNCLKGKKLDEQKIPLLATESESETSDEEAAGCLQHKKMNREATHWLEQQGCIEEQSKFEEHGYWNLSFIASMRQKEFRAIGIKKRGFVLRLEKATTKLPPMVIETKVPRNIPDWLEALQMEEYTEVFHRAGYSKEEDVGNLKELSERDLNRMGVVKMAHVNRLMEALNSLFHPTAVEVQIYEAKKDVKNIRALLIQDDESLFWANLTSNELKPVMFQMQQTSADIDHKLKTLRNTTLGIFLLVNIMWIVLLYTVTFPQLMNYHLPEQIFQLLFLAVYGLIFFISFVAMLAHRCIMLMHFLGRPEVVKEAVAPNHEEFEFVDMASPAATAETQH